jgi:hypothetical protein
MLTGLEQYTEFYQNGSALNQSTQVWSHAEFFKGTIYQKILPQ